MVSLNIEKKINGELTKQNITKSNHSAIYTEDYRNNDLQMKHLR